MISYVSMRPFLAKDPIRCPLMKSDFFDDRISEFADPQKY